MRVIFMGTPAFALPSLKRLVEEGHGVVLVVTQPDRRAGRGLRLQPPPVKVAAEALGLPVLQPETLKDEAVIARLQGLAPDVLVVAAYGRFVPKAILDIPRLGCYNVHPSLLPKFRGPAPIHRALMAGEEETGVTIIRMDEGMDTGPILLQKVTPILPEDTAGSLEDRLAVLGAEALAEALWLVEKNEASLVPQEHGLATYAPKLKEEEGRLQWSWEARRLHNLIRGFSPEPGAYTLFRGKRLKILRSALVSEEEGGQPGTILAIGKEGFVVATGRGALRLLEVQPEGRRRMTAAEFARGTHLRIGEAFDGS